ncbi:MAG TPA: transposase [Burkholderiales bacterium]|nr:transposase [Burkholderiales bacterium]
MQNGATFQHKMREGMVRGYNVGLLSGDLEMNGAHQSGHRAAEKRGKPQVSKPFDASTSEAELDEAMLTDSGRKKAKKKPEGAIDPEYNRRLPKDRRILLAVMRRADEKGKGGFGTRVAVGLAENSEVLKSVLERFVAAPESALNTDTSPAYGEVGRSFREHRAVEHAKEVVGPNGENNNQVGSFNWRMDRAEGGIHLNIEPKYIWDYACEMALRHDTRRLSNGAQLKFAFATTLSVGRSVFWTGFTHGRHRDVELL